jgi:hypothetical protein
MYVTGIHEVLWGGLLLAVTLTMHGFGMMLVLRVYGIFKDRLEQSRSVLLGIGNIILGSWIIILVHLTEVFVWAGFFLWQGAVNSGTPAAANFSLCYYFSLWDYTCLGSNYNLVLRWRLLEGMIAIAGLLTFAWSTGVLLTLAQDFHDQPLEIVKERQARKHPKPQAPSINLQGEPNLS